jgi:RimJ/RimL family protein N-acetyltransferase
MDAPTAIRIRPAETDADRARWLEIRNAVDIRSWSAATLELETGHSLALRLILGSVGQGDVGAGMAAWGATLAESRTAFIKVWVLPEDRHRGLGTALAADLFAFALDGGQERCASATVEGDEASLRFATRLGLSIEGRAQYGSLDLSGPETAGPTAGPDDIAIASYAERPDLVRAIYELDLAVMPEVPAMRGLVKPSFEAWSADTIDDPALSHDMSLVALEGDRVVGSIEIYDEGDGVAIIGLTAVDPAARRRGIATRLKVEMARRARAAGWRRVDTQNDGSNEAIRGLNARLGYVYDAPRLLVRGPLVRSAD